VLPDGRVVLDSAEAVKPIISTFCPGFPRLIDMTEEAADGLQDRSLDSGPAPAKGFSCGVLAFVPASQVCSAVGIRTAVAGVRVGHLEQGG
jgi:hypothetical protein